MPATLYFNNMGTKAKNRLRSDVKVRLSLDKRLYCTCIICKEVKTVNFHVVLIHEHLKIFMSSLVCQLLSVYNPKCDY